MAASHPHKHRVRPSAKPRRSWRSIIMGTLKVLAALYFTFVILYQLTNTSENPAGVFSSLFLIGLLCFSVTYGLFISSQVQLSLPGIDAHAIESKDSLTTIQVTRLSSKATSITVVNNSPLPILRAETVLALAFEPKDEQAGIWGGVMPIKSEPFSLRAHGSYPTTLSHAFDHVGIFLLSSAGIRVYDLLRLFSRTNGATGQWRIRVVPNIYRLTYGIPRKRKVLQTSLGIPKTPADALDYDRVRDYQPGDPLKTIHWKLVAHSNGEFYTKLFETPTVSSITLVFDPYGQDAIDSSSDLAFHLYDTMLEGGFSLLEHARENDMVGRLRFVNRTGALVEVPWEGPGMLGWFVESALRPQAGVDALMRSVQAIRSLRDARAGYVIYATSRLSEKSVEALISCQHAGIPLLVVHALPEPTQRGYTQQHSFDERLQRAAIDVVGLTRGSQIVQEVSPS